VPVVCFDDLHVVSVTERARCRLDKPKRNVHARDMFGAFTIAIFPAAAAMRSSCSAENRSFRSHAHLFLSGTAPGARASLRTGEIDEAVAFRNSVGQAGKRSSGARTSHQLSASLR